MEILFPRNINMDIKNFLFVGVTASTLLGWASKCSDDIATPTDQTDPKIENVDNLFKANPKILSIIEKKQDVKKELSICLEPDQNSHTHTNILESIVDPENTVLEFPVDQLFNKYGNRAHPLAVSWVSRNFKSLLWKWWIEETKIPQKLNHRSEWITSETKYEVGDTIRFTLINPALKGQFSQTLSNQLQEDWFTTFSDTDWSISINANKKADEKPDFVYDIVVKSLPTWESALALYRDWKLFMATYVSVGLRSRKTKTWQFKVLNKNPYYYSRKYKSPMPDWLQFDEWWFWFHQWVVTKRPASHGCVRLPGLYAAAMYSLTKSSPDIDVFISNNLYNNNK